MSFRLVAAPTLFFWGEQSFLPISENDPRYNAIPNRRMIKVPAAGQWLHHDALTLFLAETTAFLASSGSTCQ